MDALALGAAAAAWMRIPEWRAATTRSLPYLPWAALVIWAIGAVLTRDYARTGFATQTFGQSLLAIIFTLAVVAAARPPGESSSLYVRVLSWAPLRSVGKYSFAMYVVHFPLNKWLGYPLATALVPHPGAFAAIVYGTVMVLLSYLIAWASFHLYEQHFLRLKKYFSAHGDARTATA
jgi:peptidoglycan/LPS O-acetylase OafA/YrhL